MTAESACYNCLSDLEKSAAGVYLLAKIRASIYGSEAATDVPTLRQEAACATCEPKSVLNSMLLRVAADLAVDVEAVEMAPTATQLRAAIKCYCGIGPKELQAMLLLLLCSIVADFGQD